MDGPRARPKLAAFLAAAGPAPRPVRHLTSGSDRLVGRVACVPSAGRQPVACGVDIGSTNTKLVVLAPDGRVVARTSRSTPRDADGLSIDVAALLAAVEEMIVQACGGTYQVHAVCVVGVGEDGVFVDAGLQPVAPSLTWFDPRRRHVFAALRPDLDDDGTVDADSDPARGFVGWAWSRGQPGFERATAWIAVADLAGVRWAGRPFLSDTLASRTGAWRSADRSWCTERVDLTLGSTDLLPGVVRAGAVVGELTAPGWTAAGIAAADAVVVAGGHDHPIGGWAVDQLVPGAILDSMGTAEVVVTRAETQDGQRRAGLDIAPGIRSAGSTLLLVEELTRNVSWAAQDPAVAAPLAEILAGTLAPLAVLDADWFRPGGRGGGRPAYAPDAPRDPRARASAVLGALARTGRDAVLALQQSLPSGRPVRMAGGWSRYPGWLDIKAAVNADQGFEAPPVTEPEVSAVGAALLAAAGRGWTPDPATALGG